MIWYNVTEYLPEGEVLVAESLVFENYDDEEKEHSYFLQYRYFAATAMKWEDDTKNVCWYWNGGGRTMKINPLDKWAKFDRLSDDAEKINSSTLKIYTDLDQKLLSSEFK